MVVLFFHRQQHQPFTAAVGIFFKVGKILGGGNAQGIRDICLHRPCYCCMTGSSRWRNITAVSLHTVRALRSNEFKQGETVRFVVKNLGQVKHEFSLGTKKELAEHSALMKKFPDMVHDEPNKVSLEPGQQGEVVWQFTKPGNVDFACLHPGHYDAGMKGQVKVTKK